MCDTESRTPAGSNQESEEAREVVEVEEEEESRTIELPDSDLVLVWQLVLERVSHRTLVVRPHDRLQC